MPGTQEHDPCSGRSNRWCRLAAAVPALCLLVLLFAVDVFAHHILGLPHYAYDEDYPQAPVLTYVVNAGAHKVRMTGYPGKPTPGENCSLHVTINRLDDDKPFDSAVTLTVFQDRLIGQDPVVYGPVEARLEQAVYKFFPRFADEANYTARIEFRAGGEPWTIDLPMVAGEPGSPWAVLGCALGGLVVFLVVVRAIRIKMKRCSEEEGAGEAPGGGDVP